MIFLALSALIGSYSNLYPGLFTIFTLQLGIYLFLNVSRFCRDSISPWLSGQTILTPAILECVRKPCSSRGRARRPQQIGVSGRTLSYYRPDRLFCCPFHPPNPADLPFICLNLHLWPSRVALAPNTSFQTFLASLICSSFPPSETRKRKNTRKTLALPALARKIAGL